MNPFLRITRTLALLAIFAFCMFGFLATFEPLDYSVLPWRIGYSFMGVFSIGGIIVLFRRLKPAP